MSERPGTARITPLDGLRGVAIGLVLLHHYVQLKLPHAPGWPRALAQSLQLSWSGVDLFFVLSGFLIGGILLDHRESPRLLPVFYLRRTLRILPLYYGTLLVLFLRLHIGPYSPLPAWVQFVFASNIGMALVGMWDESMLSVTWSLAVEEQFYLVAPWVVRWTSPARLPRLLVSVIITAWLLRLVALVFDGTGLSSHLLMPCRMDALAFGMLAAWAVRSAAARAWLEHHMPRWWVPVAVAAVPLVFLTLRSDELGGWALPSYGYTCLGVFYAGIVYAVVARQPGCLVRFLSWKPLVNLGRLSYFIYLWHMIVLLALGRHLMGKADFALNSPAALGAVLACVAATWILAAISWRLFESPLIRLGHRHAY